MARLPAWILGLCILTACASAVEQAVPPPPAMYGFGAARLETVFPRASALDFGLV